MLLILVFMLRSIHVAWYLSLNYKSSFLLSHLFLISKDKTAGVREDIFYVDIFRSQLGCFIPGFLFYGGSKMNSM